MTAIIRSASQDPIGRTNDLRAYNVNVVNEDIAFLWNGSLASPPVRQAILTNLTTLRTACQTGKIDYSSITCTTLC